MPEVGGQPLLGQVHARAEVDDRADVEPGPGDHGDRDLVLDRELAGVDGERSRGALSDELAAKQLDLHGRELHGLGDDIDLVAIRLRRDPARERRDLRRRQQVIGQRDARRGVRRERGPAADHVAEIERDRVVLVLRAERELTRQRTETQRAEGLAPRTVLHLPLCEYGHAASGSRNSAPDASSQMDETARGS